MAYGGYELQRGDQDPKKGKTTKWANKEVTVEKKTAKASSEGKGEDKATTLAVVTNHVEQLQKDLRHLGFALVGTPDGGFGLGTEFAVREFQYYASLEKVAEWTGKDDTGAHEVKVESKKASEAEEQRVKDAAKDFPKVSAYVAGLKQVDNGKRYTGAITGKVNTATAEAIEHWKTEKYRCPVVIEGWTFEKKDKKKPKKVRKYLEPTVVNLWDKNDDRETAHRMRAFDLSGVYTLPTQYADDTYLTLGDFSKKSDDKILLGGPNVRTAHAWSEASTNPEGFSGKAWSALTPAEKSTFKVVRLSAENECYGRFDVVNCWDNAFVSLGPCHWTLALSAGAEKGELGAFLEYVDGKATTDEPPWYRACGLRSLKGKLSDMTNQRKYTGEVAIVTGSGATDFEKWPRSTGLTDRRKELNQLRTWHWAFRWIMAGRATDARFVTWRHRMWDMARKRIQDLLAAELKISQASQSRLTNGLKATVGEVFRSEWAVALLLRWHIWRPGRLISSKAATTRLKTAVEKAIGHGAESLEWTTTAAGKPQGWEDAHETALIWGLKCIAQGYSETALTKDGKKVLKAWNAKQKEADRVKRKNLVPTKATQELVDKAEDYSSTWTKEVSGHLTIVSQKDEDDPTPKVAATLKYKLPAVCDDCDNFKWTVDKVEHKLNETRETGAFQGVYPDEAEAEAVGADVGGDAGADLPVADTP